MGEAEEDSKRIRKLVDDEYFDLKLYEMILKDLKDRKKRKIVEQLYEKEKRDLEALLSLSKGYKPRVSRAKLFLYYLLYKIFGLTFVVRFAESDEEKVLREYRNLLNEEDEREKRTLLKQLIRSTRRYEYMLRKRIKDERLKYLSFIALGITDGVISLIGTQAGFLGATENSLYVAISTLIVGIATSISMGAATYLQAKEMRNGVTPLKAALSSLQTYVVVTLMLVIPFLFISNPYTAFAISFLFSLFILAIFTYYTSVVNERDFLEQLKENLAVVLMALFLGFLLGKAVSIFVENPT